MSETTALELHNLRKSFGGRTVLAIKTLRIVPGEMVALLGASGSGKSTLLRLAAGMQVADADSGELRVNGLCLQSQGKLARAIRRQRHAIGFIFQQFNLVGRLPLIINVLAGALGRVPFYRSLFEVFTKQEWSLARAALQRVSLQDYQWQRTDSLSGGQQQRAAIARTLVQQAQLLLADEPVASLDPQSAEMVMELLQDLNRTERLTVVVALHQVELAMRYCSRVIALRQGEVIYDGSASALSAADYAQFYQTSFIENSPATKERAA